MSAKQKRPLDSGRRDSLNRRVMVSAGASAGRATAPAPDVDAEWAEIEAAKVSVERLLEFRRRCAEQDDERLKQSGDRIPVRLGDYVVFDSPATGPSYYTVVGARMERKISGHDGTSVTWAETGKMEWIVQGDDGQMSVKRFEQRPWKNLSEQGFDREGGGRPRVPKPGVLLTADKDLSSMGFTMTDPARAEALGVAAEGMQVIENRNGGMSYVKDSGRNLKATRNRPKMAVMHRYEMTTEVEERDGRPVIVGRPGEMIGEMYVRADATTRDGEL